MKKLSLISLLPLALLPAANAQLNIGDTIGVDFGSVAPTGTNTFNQISVGGDASTAGLVNGASVVLNSLVDVGNNAVSGVAFTFTNNTGQIAWDHNTNQGQAGIGFMDDVSVYGDGVISNNASGRNLPADAHFTMTFTGLEDGYTYDLSGGYEFNNANFNATWEADGQDFTTNIAGGEGYGTLTGLTTDGSGNLVITVTRSNHVEVGAFTLTAVPEPSSYALLAGCLALGAVMVRRRS